MTPYTLPEPVLMATVPFYDGRDRLYNDAQMHAAFAAGAASRDADLKQAEQDYRAKCAELEIVRAELDGLRADGAYKQGFSDGLKEAPEGFPTMQDALDAGDGVLHGTIDALQARVAQLEGQVSLLAESNTGRLQRERDALAEELAAARAQEPVAYRYKFRDMFGREVWSFNQSCIDIIETQPLFSAPTPPVREPLTDAEIDAVYEESFLGMYGESSFAQIRAFAREIEAAIKEQK